MSTTEPSSFSLSEITTYQAGVAQSAVHRLLQKVCDDYLQRYGISKMHWLIIGTVLDAGEEGMRLTELAEKMQTGMPYLTTTINLLESKGMLNRVVSEHDARAKAVTVSKSFAKKCPEIELELRKRLRETVYAKVSTQDFTTYMRVLYSLREVD